MSTVSDRFLRNYSYQCPLLSKFLIEIVEGLIFIFSVYNPLQPSVRIIALVSHTTYAMCVNFIHKWQDLKIKVDSEWQIFRETFHKWAGVWNLASQYLLDYNYCSARYYVLKLFFFLVRGVGNSFDAGWNNANSVHMLLCGFLKVIVQIKK